MNKGIIYLIQPCELVGTNRYKIGCSQKNDLDRCKNGYKKGSRYLCIMECNNPINIEKLIKETFMTKFKLIAGAEYFEGNENIILQNFLEIVIKNKDNIIEKPYEYALMDIDDDLETVDYSNNYYLNKFNCHKCNKSFIRKHNFDKHYSLCNN